MDMHEPLAQRIARLTQAKRCAVTSAAGEMRLMQQQQRWRYLCDAGRAAREERAGQYARAAQAWETALKSAWGKDVSWCRARIALCWLYARAPRRDGGLYVRAS
ncbi:hypothetical protein D3Z09_18245 [Rahnella aquatilis]|nr:hypothetical protein D3Z09_18245 [Rahnella aquatilis]